MYLNTNIEYTSVYTINQRLDEGFFVLHFRCAFQQHFT